MVATALWWQHIVASSSQGARKPGGWSGSLQMASTFLLCNVSLGFQPRGWHHSRSEQIFSAQLVLSENAPIGTMDTAASS